MADKLPLVVDSGQIKELPSGDFISSAKVSSNVVGSPAGGSTLRRHISTIGSSGVLDGTLTYVTVGSTAVKVSVASGEGFIRTSNDQQGDLVFCTWAASADIYTFSAPAAGQENTIFIGIEYSGGSVTAVTKTSFTDWNWHSNFPLARCSYDGTTLRILNAYAHAEDTANLTRQYLRYNFPFIREQSPEGSGGLEVSSSGRNLALTAGNLWHGFNRYSISALASGVAFDTHYRRSGGGFNKTSGVTSWPNTQYDNGSGTLQDLTNNRYGALWVYLDVSDGSLDVLYGAVNATSVSDAQADTAPSIPAHLTYHGRLIARIIFQKSAASASLVESVWASTFMPTTVGDHGNLAGLTDDDHTQYVLANGTRNITGPQIITVNSASDALRITQTGAGNALVVEDAANPDSSPFVIDANGLAVFGHTAAIPAYAFNNQLQVLSTTNAYQLNAAFRADAFSPILTIAHSRNAAIGSHTILQNADETGILAFAGSDGTAFIRTAQISSAVDGTPGTNDMPGRLVFSTTADGASSPTERMRIDSSGNVSIGGSSSAATLVVTGSAIGSLLGDATELFRNYFSTGNIIYLKTSGIRHTAGANWTGVGVRQQCVVDVTPMGFMEYNPVGYQFGLGFGSGSTLLAALSSDGDLTLLDNDPVLEIGSSAVSTGSCILRLGNARTGSGYAHIDLIGDTTYTTYGLRIIRDNAGANTTSQISHRGTGDFALKALEAAAIGFYTSNTERLRIDSSGNVSIGSTTTGQSFYVSKNITGSTFASGIYAGATIQSDVTSRGSSYISVLATAASAFTLTNMPHYAAYQGTIGAGSTVTSQFGFFVDSSLTGAANNFGFYGNIASGTNRYNFYAAGTADNYFAGRVSIGTLPPGDSSLVVAKTITGATTAYGIRQYGTIQSDVTTTAYSIISSPSTQAAAFTLGALHHFMAYQGTVGAGSTVTNQYGYSVSSSLTGATNNYGFYGDIAAGTNRYNLYMNGTADNYFAGNVGIGIAPVAYSLYIYKNSTGAINAGGIAVAATMQSDVTANGKGIATYLQTQATAFTLTNLLHFEAQQGTIGAGSTVTNQFGFYVASNLTGATNNYGFYGNIASGTGRYNLYMSGTAQNYLAGKLGIGTLPATAYTLKIGENITGATTAYSVMSEGTIQSDVTLQAVYYRSQANTANAAFTLTNLVHFYATQGTITGGSRTAPTVQYGFLAESSLTGASTNIGFYGNIASGSARWNFYAGGTADNAFLGNVRIGSVTAPTVALDVTGAAKISSTLTPAALLDLSTSTAGQIKFPATQNASSDANTLDDYEEGTWTPTVAYLTQTTAPTHSTTGKYTKIGRLVQFTIVCGFFTKGSGTGALSFTLPFTDAGQNEVCTAYVSIVTAGVGTFIGKISPGNGYVYLVYIPAGGTIADITSSQLNDSSTIYVTGTYVV
jgi:hypothetical protein